MPSKCKSVDLPAPEGPMMETNSPSLISALMRRRTKVLVGPCSKYFSTFRRTIKGELIDTLILLRTGHRAPLFFPWRMHSCVPRRDSPGTSAQAVESKETAWPRFLPLETFPPGTVRCSSRRLFVYNFPIQKLASRKSRRGAHECARHNTWRY